MQQSQINGAPDWIAALFTNPDVALSTFALVITVVIALVASSGVMAATRVFAFRFAKVFASFLTRLANPRTTTFKFDATFFEANQDGVIDVEEKEKILAEAKKLNSRIKLLSRRNRNYRQEIRLLRDFHDPLERPIERLRDENRRLSRFAWINLLIGIAFAVLGISVLMGAILVNGPTQQAPFQIDTNRITLSILVNLIAFFFFRMYLSAQHDIKQNQNEMTALEMKLAALRLGRLTEQPDAVLYLIMKLSDAERNFVLNKSQRLASESQVHDRNEIMDFVKAAIQFRSKPEAATTDKSTE